MSSKIKRKRFNILEVHGCVQSLQPGQRMWSAHHIRLLVQQAKLREVLAYHRSVTNPPDTQ